MSTAAKDLTKEAPASPAVRVGGYAILARLADKARAKFLGGNLGDYHTGCSLNRYLLDRKAIPYDEIKREIVAGADDQVFAMYLNLHGQPKSPKKSKRGLDPASAATLQWLEPDDKDTVGSVEEMLAPLRQTVRR